MAVDRSRFRTLLNVALIALVVHAVWKVGPVLIRYVDFRDTITEAARFSGDRAANELRKQILTIAEQAGVPLDAQALEVEKSGRRVRIRARYTEDLEIFPRYFYPREFTISIDTGLARTDIR